MCSHSLSHFLYTASVPVCPLMDLLARSIYTAALLTYSIPSGHFRKGSPCYRLCCTALLYLLILFVSPSVILRDIVLFYPLNVPIKSRSCQHTNILRTCMHAWLTLRILKIRLIHMLCSRQRDMT